MKRKISGLILLAVTASSCSSERVSLSPLYESITSEGTVGANPRVNGRHSDTAVFYASELTTQVSNFPTFTNDALNREVDGLKYNVKDYVYAVEAYNTVRQEQAMTRIQKSYKNIQKLRAFLKLDENEVINRYLVRIKSNLSQLDNAVKKKTFSKQ